MAGHAEALAFFKNRMYIEKARSLVIGLVKNLGGERNHARSGAADLCLAFSFLDIVRISAEPFASNLASRRVLEKAGFLLEGILQKSVFKNGKLFDSCIYTIIQTGDV